MPQQLRGAFLTREDLSGEAIAFCKSRGVSESPAQIVASLLGTGPHKFHHLEPNLSQVFQGDIDTLADMIDRDTRSTHAVHAGGAAGFPPYPAYLYHQRQHFSLEAIDHRTGEWRYWHLTTLREHLMDRLEARLVALASAQVPRVIHRVSLGGGRVELVDVTSSAREDIEASAYSLGAYSLGAFSLSDWARGVIKRAIRKAEEMLGQETARLRDELKELHGPSGPRRMVVDASLADLFEEARRQSAVVALDDGAV